MPIDNPIKTLTGPVVRHFQEQWSDGMMKDLSAATGYAEQAFGNTLVLDDPNELRYYLTDAKLPTRYDAAVPSWKSERMQFANNRLQHFSAAAKAKFFDLPLNVPLPENLSPELADQFATRVFDLIATLCPEHHSSQDDWENSVGPLLFVSMLSQFPDTGEMLALGTIDTSDDIVVAALNKQFYDRVPTAEYEFWLRTVGEYHSLETADWLKYSDYLDERGRSSSIQFQEWRVEGLTGPKVTLGR